MVKNNNGVTLIELLGALTLTVIIFSLLFGVFQIGSKSYQKDITANRFQTDANVVISTVSTLFYKKSGQPFDITVKNGKVYIDNKTASISSPTFDYTGSTFSWGDHLLTIHLIVNSNNTSKIKPFELKTSLNFPWKESHQ